jgi:hypothetical protein
MEYMHPDLRKRTQDRRRYEAERYAASWRLLKRARVRSLGWLSERGCWLLCQIGRLLVWSGYRLQQAGAMQAS